MALRSLSLSRLLQIVVALPLLAMAVLGYLMYSAGAEPAEIKDKYQAWYIGAGVLGSGILVALAGKFKRSAQGAAGQTIRGASS